MHRTPSKRTNKVSITRAGKRLNIHIGEGAQWASTRITFAEARALARKIQELVDDAEAPAGR